MIRKLQRKLILISALAVFIVLTAVIVLVNIFNFRREYSQIDTILSVIVEYNGIVPKYTEKTSGDYNMTRESSYQLRYFTVTLDEDDNITDSNLSHIAAVQKDDLDKIKNDILNNRNDDSLIHDGVGYYTMDDYTYAYKITKSPEDKDNTMLVVLDCTSEMETADSFLGICLQFGVLCMIFFVVVVSALSRKALKPFIRNMENQKQFITNAGHELKTPIAIISANTEVLEMMEGENEWTRSIMNQVKRLSGLIGDLISMTRMTEQVDFVLTDLDYSPIVEESAESFRTVAEQQDKKMETDIEAGIHMEGEEKLLQELTNILIDNAVKYCDENGTVRVALHHRTKNKGVRLTVQNSYKDGKNVDYRRFFERFYREDTSHNSKKSGYGIGLSMAESLVQIMKGKISVSWADGIISFAVTF